MKRIAAFIVAVAVAAVGCIFTGCQPKKKEIESVKVTKQNSEVYEDALKECFEAMQSVGGGEVFYSYMYPNETINAMKENNEYEELIKNFNDSQRKSLEKRDKKYTFKSIMEAHQLTEKQVSGVKNYLVELSEPYLSTLTEDKLDVKDGYEVTYNYVKSENDVQKETVIIFKLNDEGWKVITR